MERLADALKSLALAAMILASSGVAYAKERVEVWMFLSNAGPEGQAMTSLAERFEAKNPDVDIELVWGVNMDKLVAGILGGQKPDIVQVQGDWVNSLAHRGILASVDGFLRPAGLSLDRYWPPLLQQLRYQGKHYGLPWTLNAHFALWWNKQVVSEVGGDPQHPAATLSSYTGNLPSSRATERSNASGSCLGPPATLPTPSTSGVVFSVVSSTRRAADVFASMTPAVSRPWNGC